VRDVVKAGLQPVLGLNECGGRVTLCQWWRRGILCAVRGSLLLRRNTGSSSIHLSLLLQASYYELNPTSLLFAFHVRNVQQVCECTLCAAVITLGMQYGNSSTRQ